MRAPSRFEREPDGCGVERRRDYGFGPHHTGGRSGVGHSQVFLAGQGNTWFLPGFYQVFTWFLTLVFTRFSPGSKSQVLLVFNDHQCISAEF